MRPTRTALEARLRVAYAIERASYQAHEGTRARLVRARIERAKLQDDLRERRHD